MVAFVFVEARALESGTGEPLVRLFSVAYPPDFLLRIFPFSSVTNHALDSIFEFGGAVLFFLLTRCWLQEVDPRFVRRCIGWLSVGVECCVRGGTGGRLLWLVQVADCEF